MSTAPRADPNHAMYTGSVRAKAQKPRVPRQRDPFPGAGATMAEKSAWMLRRASRKAHT